MLVLLLLLLLLLLLSRYIRVCLEHQPQHSTNQSPPLEHRHLNHDQHHRRHWHHDLSLEPPWPHSVSKTCSGSASPTSCSRRSRRCSSSWLSWSAPSFGEILHLVLSTSSCYHQPAKPTCITSRVTLADPGAFQPFRLTNRFMLSSIVCVNFSSMLSTFSFLTPVSCYRTFCSSQPLTTSFFQHCVPSFPPHRLPTTHCCL